MIYAVWVREAEDLLMCVERLQTVNVHVGAETGVRLEGVGAEGTLQRLQPARFWLLADTQPRRQVAAPQPGTAVRSK